VYYGLLLVYLNCLFIFILWFVADIFYVFIKHVYGMTLCRITEIIRHGSWDGYNFYINFYVKLGYMHTKI